MSAVLFQTMPPLAPEEYAQLEASCLAHGIQVPIIVDENGTVIDGHHRQKIAQEHGIYLPTETRDTLTDAEKTTLSISLNIDRRQLSREQRRAIIAASVKAQPEKPDYQHAKALGVSPHTVRSVRDDLESDLQIANDVPRVNERGQERPATYTRTETTTVEESVAADPVTGEVIDAPTHTKPAPKPAADAEQVNAETMSKDLGRSLMSLSGMKYPEHRARLIERWLPAGNEAVPSDWKALIEPNTIREIAGWLMEFANDLEGSRA